MMRHPFFCPPFTVVRPEFRNNNYEGTDSATDEKAEENFQYFVLDEENKFNKINNIVQCAMKNQKLRKSTYTETEANIN